jgi:hypothetical protein
MKITSELSSGAKKMDNRMIGTSERMAGLTLAVVYRTLRYYVIFLSSPGRLECKPAPFLRVSADEFELATVLSTSYINARAAAPFNCMFLLYPVDSVRTGIIGRVGFVPLPKYKAKARDNISTCRYIGKL